MFRETAPEQICHRNICQLRNGHIDLPHKQGLASTFLAQSLSAPPLLLSHMAFHSLVHLFPYLEAINN